MSLCVSVRDSLLETSELSMSSLSDLCPLVTVSSLPEVGRCALAARDIEAGELVMEDEAVMVSPGGGRRLCLECGAGAEEGSCQECGLPLCCAGQGARLDISAATSVTFHR